MVHLNVGMISFGKGMDYVICFGEMFVCAYVYIQSFLSVRVKGATNFKAEKSVLQASKVWETLL